MCIEKACRRRLNERSGIESKWWCLNINCISENRNENLYDPLRLGEKGCDVRLGTMRRKESKRSAHRINLNSFLEFPISPSLTKT